MFFTCIVIRCPEKRCQNFFKKKKVKNKKKTNKQTNKQTNKKKQNPQLTQVQIHIVSQGNSNNHIKNLYILATLKKKKKKKNLKRQEHFQIHSMKPTLPRYQVRQEHTKMKMTGQYL